MRAMRVTVEDDMADKDLKNLSDGTPRDASKMGSNGHTWAYVALGVVVAGLLLYWFGVFA
jgi:hypothetical protein